MKYYFPTFDEIDSLRKDYVDAFIAARRLNCNDTAVQSARSHR